VGGGALPLHSLPTRLVAVSPGAAGASAVEARLRRGQPPVLVRIQEDRLLLDLRTVPPAEDDRLRDAVLEAIAGEGSA
jgi:L-seryl-tRNA(Ser) seleniumtransferase